MSQYRFAPGDRVVLVREPLFKDKPNPKAANALREDVGKTEFVVGELRDGSGKYGIKEDSEHRHYTICRPGSREDVGWWIQEECLDAPAGEVTDDEVAALFGLQSASLGPAAATPRDRLVQVLRRYVDADKAEVIATAIIESEVMIP